MDSIFDEAGMGSLLVHATKDIQNMLDVAVPASWWRGEKRGRGLIRDMVLASHSHMNPIPKASSLVIVLRPWRVQLNLAVELIRAHLVEFKEKARYQIAFMPRIEDWCIEVTLALTLNPNPNPQP